MNWIDIKEQLPELKDGQSETVLGFYNENGRFYIGFFELDIDGITVFTEDSEHFVISITHWAKLTPP